MPGPPGQDGSATSLPSMPVPIAWRPAEESSHPRRSNRAGARGPGDTVRAVAPLTPEQLRTRERVETVIRLVAPALNVVLAVGDRLSRIVEPEDHEYYPPRTRAGTEPPPSDAREPHE